MLSFSASSIFILLYCAMYWALRSLYVLVVQELPVSFPRMAIYVAGVWYGGLLPIFAMNRPCFFPLNLFRCSVMFIPSHTNTKTDGVHFPCCCYMCRWRFGTRFPFSTSIQRKRRSICIQHTNTWFECWNPFGEHAKRKTTTTIRKRENSPYLYLDPHGIYAATHIKLEEGWEWWILGA